MYDKQKQKELILERLTHQEAAFTKNDNFHRAINFALDEIEELEQLYVKFTQTASHLIVFQTLVEASMNSSMNKTIDNLKYLAEKTYTKEEKDKMPYDVLMQVQATEQRRMTLLKNIAYTYMQSSKKD